MKILFLPEKKVSSLFIIKTSGGGTSGRARPFYRVCAGNNKNNSQTLTALHKPGFYGRRCSKVRLKPLRCLWCRTAPWSHCRTRKRLIKAEVLSGLIASMCCVIMCGGLLRLQLSSRVPLVLLHALIRSNLFQKHSCAPFPLWNLFFYFFIFFLSFCLCLFLFLFFYSAPLHHIHSKALKYAVM